VVVDGIGLLVTNRPEMGEGPLGLLRDAAVVADGDRVSWVGPASQIPGGAPGPRLDAGGRCLIPGFVDSHTHLVFAGDRSDEFAARMAGLPYRAGGISTTVASTRAATEAELTARAERLAREALASGTTTIEVKSGYGLTVFDEARILLVTSRLADRPDLPSVDPTFLGAHVVPPEHLQDPDGYVELVRGPMLEACAPRARWCDAFCERGAFDADQCREVLRAGAAHGLGLRLHANQLGPGPGAQLAAEVGATSADHLTHLSPADVDALTQAGVVATLLPVAEFSTRSPYPDARRLLAAGVVVALATDCNPGTSYTTCMPLVVALAVREMGLTPDQALWGATAGGAAALDRQDIGALGPGDRADMVLLEAPSHIHLAYRPGVPLVGAVVLGGSLVVGQPPAGVARP
jgi:imidazolonepropionase